MSQWDETIAELFRVLREEEERDAELHRALDSFVPNSPEHQIAETLIEDGWYGTPEELITAARTLAHG